MEPKNFEKAFKEYGKESLFLDEGYKSKWEGGSIPIDIGELLGVAEDKFLTEDDHEEQPYHLPLHIRCFSHCSTF